MTGYEGAARFRNLLVLDPPGGESLAPLVEALRSRIGPECVVHQVGSQKELLACLASGFPYHLAVIELEHGDGARTGEEIMPVIRRADPEIPVIAVADSGDVDSAKRAVRSGANDFLVLGVRLPERVETLLAKLTPMARVIEDKRRLQEENVRLAAAARGHHRILGESPQIVELLARVSRVAPVPRPVLVLGERGTGKELVAREIHAVAGDGERPFVAVNCAAFTDALLESELFGHEKGAFTGADERRRGRFEQASGGTLFLDEVGFMSLPFQQKILRVVEYGSFRRVGGTEEVRTTARVIAATNVDLEARMESGEFLRDLYDRLAFEVIRVPALRDREGDVELLAREFLIRFGREIPAFQGKSLSRRALESLRRYDFPGNVRELKNIIERAACKDTTNEITPEDMELPSTGRAGRHGLGFHEQVEALKESLIHDALSKCGGRQAEAARRLGLTYDQFRHFYRKYS